MSTERTIGIDFGTSTSVIRMKTYIDGKPEGSIEMKRSREEDRQ